LLSSCERLEEETADGKNEFMVLTKNEGVEISELPIVQIELEQDFFFALHRAS
jgi:hypothetical protein